MLHPICSTLKHPWASTNGLPLFWGWIPPNKTLLETSPNVHHGFIHLWDLFQASTLCKWPRKCNGLSMASLGACSCITYGLHVQLLITPYLQLKPHAWSSLSQEHQKTPKSIATRLPPTNCESLALRTWAPTGQLARRWAMFFIPFQMAALPPPAVGGGANHPPKFGRDGSASQPSLN